MLARLDALAENGLLENTLVVFTSDNGSPRQITSRLEGRELTGGKEWVPHDRFQWVLVLAFACMLLALPLARLWRIPLGRFIVLALFLRLRLAFWVSLGIPISFMGGFLFAGMMVLVLAMIANIFLQMPARGK